MLLEHFSEIKKLSVLTLKFTDNITYKFAGVVITPYMGHFFLYINCLNMSKVPYNLIITLIIILMILNNNSLIIEVNSFESLLNNSYEHYISFYILIYIKS